LSEISHSVVRVVSPLPYVLLDSERE